MIKQQSVEECRTLEGTLPFPPGSPHPLTLVLIPGWLQSVLESEKKELKEVLNPETMFSILSEDDVAFYFFINENRHFWIDQSIDLSLGVYDRSRWGISDDKMKTMGSLVSEHRVHFDWVSRERGVEYMKGGYGIVENISLSSGWSGKVVNFNVVELDDTHLGLIPYSIDTEVYQNKQFDNQIGMMEELMPFLNLRFPLEEIASTELFKDYIKRLF